MRLLVVSDGRRGIENQALGLAEAVARLRNDPTDIDVHTLGHHAAFSALPPSLQLIGRKSFNLPDADLVIGCGRQAIAPLIALKRSHSSAFTCYVQDPRLDPSRFDLVVAPDHDGLSGPNVETMIGSPNRITRERIVTDLFRFAERLNTLPQPRAMIAIGGPSRTHKLSDANRQAHLDAARTLLSEGYHLVITTSRRTPDAVRSDWKALADRSDAVWLHTPDSPGDNPYFAFLGAADLILVTEESTNMLTEACTTGKPVFRLSMDGDAGKFAHLYTALETRCHVQQWDPASAVLTDHPAPYDPLDETQRVAERLLNHMQGST